MIRRPTRLWWVILTTAAVLFFVGIWAILFVGAAALLSGLPD